ncbi:hypothetical protein QKD39_gp32 [Psittacine adenovirus 1]|uniref:Uncharacterized protein n=1 Tax=Psittacine adenovirus 1 TaxID=318592 RepID=A0A2Z5E1D0_9ADEN|nr:hypothetical protein QKD39_gp32 [Psittacine adenovirus 1]AXB73041.1 hypothetical protein [Psittacine adenovirus 1]
MVVSQGPAADVWRQNGVVHGVRRRRSRTAVERLKNRLLETIVLVMRLRMYQSGSFFAFSYLDFPYNRLNCLCCSFRLAIPTAVPAIPGIAPIAAAIMGIRAGRKPPRRLVRGRRVRVLVFLRRRVPVPPSGVALAIVPVTRSVAVAGAPVWAARRAAS